MMDLWVDDVREWPILSFEDVHDYFINAPACDEQPNQNYRSVVEGMRYLTSGWIDTVYHQHNNSNDVITLKANIRYSQTIAKEHSVSITICKKEHKIMDVMCDCVANRGRSCSHAAGLAFKIIEANKQGYVGVACTDKGMMWNRGTKRNVIPDTVQNIKSNSKRQLTRSDTMSFECDLALKDHLKSEVMAPLSEIRETYFSRHLRAKRICFPPAAATSTAHGNHEAILGCTACKKTYENYILLNENSAKELASKTMHQQSALWTSQRKIRITSSSAKSVPKKADTDPNTWVSNHLHPRFHGNMDTRHGTRHEAEARRKFEEVSGCNVSLTGLVVRPDESWLGASLDGVIDDDTILEIKCPTERKLNRYGGTVNGLLKSGKWEACDINGQYDLRKTTNGYYFQVQLAMFCSQRNKCKFFVWSKNDYAVVDVKFDKDWVNEQVKSLKSFYFQKLLPKITDGINQGQLKIVHL